MIGCLSEAVFIADADGVVFDANPAWTDLVGYPPEDGPFAVPYPWWPDPIRDAEDYALLNAATADFLGTDRDGFYEVPFRRPDGERIWVRCRTREVVEDGQRLIVGSLHRIDPHD